MKIICFSQHKGGTGKTTTALNTGLFLAKKGFTVLLVDMDPQANLTHSFADLNGQRLQPIPNLYHYLTGKTSPPPVPLQVKENLFLLPSSLHLAAAELELYQHSNHNGFLHSVFLPQQKNKQFKPDFILIDCPPSLSLLTLNALYVSDYVVIPMEPEIYAMDGLANLLNILSQVRTKNITPPKVLGILITKFFNTVLYNDMVSNLAQAYGPLLFQTKIRKNISISEAITQRESIYEYAPRSNGATDYESFTRELLQKMAVPFND